MGSGRRSNGKQGIRSEGKREAMEGRKMTKVKWQRAKEIGDRRRMRLKGTTKINDIRLKKEWSLV